MAHIFSIHWPIKYKSIEACCKHVLTWTQHTTDTVMLPACLPALDTNTLSSLVYCTCTFTADHKVVHVMSDHISCTLT